MAVRGPVVNIPGLKAGEDIDANIVVKLDTTEDWAVVASDADGPHLGVTTRAVKDGEAVAIESLNASAVVVALGGGALTRGQKVGVNADGEVKIQVAGKPGLGQVAIAYADGDLVQIFVDTSVST